MMPITLLVTFMEKGPPNVRPKYTMPPLGIEPEDKTIILNTGGGSRAMFRIDDQWFQDYIKKHMSWAVGKNFTAVDHGLQIIVTWS